MESLLNKFEKDRIDMSQIYGGIFTGQMLWGSSSNMTVSGREYAYFDGSCCVQCFVPDDGGPTRWLPPVC